MSTSITKQQVAHVAQLANIPLNDSQATKFVSAFAETLEVIENLQEVSTQNIEPTHQVTGLENVTRADEVVTERMFSQEAALQNAKRVHQGYFVVPRILDND